MLHLLKREALSARCVTASWSFSAAAGIAKATLKALPRDHPARIYGLARIEEGTERIKKALGRKSASQLLRDRRAY